MGQGRSGTAAGGTFVADSLARDTMNRDKILAAIRRHTPQPDENIAEEHLRRMDERYFRRFSPEEIASHAAWLSRLGPRTPCEVAFRRTDYGHVECTVCAFDNPFLFSLITGVLSANGFDTVSGEVFTWKRHTAPSSRRPVQRRVRRYRMSAVDLSRRRIIDCLTGTIPGDIELSDWSSRIQRELAAAVGGLEEGSTDSQTEARRLVHQLVAERLPSATAQSGAVLLPMEIAVDDSLDTATRLKVLSQDTPFFLYALSTGLSLQGLSIEHLDIKTIENRIQDTIDIVTDSGRRLTEPAEIDRLRLLVLLTKQFTYFLSNSPDPYSALVRFEQLVKDIVTLPDRKQWVEMLSQPRILSDLARLLGASEYLWEDFIRGQYESLLPMLAPGDRHKGFSEPIDTLSRRLRSALEGAEEEAGFHRKLNQFKDREIFLIDLDHILNDDVTFKMLAARLTALAENTLAVAADFAYRQLARRYGTPRTVAGMTALYALFGLGKFGGAALGYASDIELLFVFSDHGETDGPERIANSEFFDLVVKKINSLIEAKRDGIFELDFRLRPFGSDGPLACSLESFCRYYMHGGAAHSYERLALVRLRYIGGDSELGGRIERLRDEYIYASASINPREIRELRTKQHREKTRGDKLNAKFSTGALVDLEYDIQLLQVTYGRKEARFRTPRMDDALAQLAEAGILGPHEGEWLVSAYAFFRRVINALRMLRGSALDLTLPAEGSDELIHLARRVGYVPHEGLDAAVQLRADFDTHTAHVRAFVERHFGRKSLPGPDAVNIADVVLSKSMPETLCLTILTNAGFTNPRRALANIRRLAPDLKQGVRFSRLVVLAADMLRHVPDADMALNNWERFVSRLADPDQHYRELLAQPTRLHVLLNIFSASQFLADTLIRNPEFFAWVTTPSMLRAPRRREDIEDALRQCVPEHAPELEWLNACRKIRRREILRIGTRDICLRVPVGDVTTELSLLAEAVVQVTLERAAQYVGCSSNLLTRSPGGLLSRFCIVAFGKLGGRELNYSSDIDLLGVYEPAPGCGSSEGSLWSEQFNRLIERVCADLSNHTSEGYAYRVDMRIRPYGSAGGIAHALPVLVEYYRRSASAWEIQALLKLRPIAGASGLGERLCEHLRPLLTRPHDPTQVARHIEHMRETAVRSHVRPGEVDVKNGRGGIRDIEFLTQGLQMIHAHATPHVLSRNTLHALEKLRQFHILPAHVADNLMQRYVFLRRVEHFLQLFDDRQVHILPHAEDELRALARRVQGSGSGSKEFHATVSACLEEVHSAFRRFLLRHNAQS
ncbi:MAG: glutamate-ammonia-ligase adenylyltransferase [Chitinivibrionales bacterium]|nr:glutamate-ammonia-ligase adenylyltransferase [Chitinivibrionales bacterium]MBD3397004.1 glutamate-ammonia-ligase adenylyltransferase [Chitinivibrionales bacterium]